ncbi:NERD domain-containing protein [Flavobacterium sp. MAH-1]|uniref:NERD domain-containing protein n=1 Tax=Flavobacterium agri TaxID=2743471 RepID=A0A7Y8Y145_9FLAO|nr:nuclease-related domain-containing protein [Flavobacterium agri]NUY80532.1 NERD domain-containing protein [Flavobacterium agri]NYA70557.1 NERD domain-containing protein [Flavobacterium agri]
MSKYESAKQQIISNHTKLIEKEKADLEIQIADMEDSYSKTRNDVQNQKETRISALNKQINDLPETNSKIIPTVIDYYRNFIIWMKIWSTQLSFHSKLKSLDRLGLDIASQEKSRLNFLNLNFDYAVGESCSTELNALLRRKNVIEELENFIYGAFGEYKVVKNLETLSDEFILVNDFTCRFQPAIYNRKENDYIKSVQVDHILISRAGVFIIETKNWSEKSISNLNFHSPVRQIKRANYALFKMISDGISNSTVRLNKHHWGDRKIPVRNLIVLINKRPTEEFQFVKILTLPELTSYVEYFPPIFSIEETRSIADYFIKRSNTINPANQISVHDSPYRQ